MSFADKVNLFNSRLDFSGPLPEGIGIMNPFRENPLILPLTKKFYNKFYNDYKERYLILGINPGRHGAGVTGIPFTDTVRLEKYCGINIGGIRSYETSSEFVYNVIGAYGGVKRFYSRFYISAVCPLGFTRQSKHGKAVNYNYYDSKELIKAAYNFIVENLRTQISFNIKKELCYCLGTGKNYNFLLELNEREKLFRQIIPLEHPRFIMQYRRKKLRNYIDKYLRLLK